MPPPTYDVVADLEAEAARSRYMPASDRYIHIIDAWQELAGPSQGTATLPAHLSEYDGETTEIGPTSLPDVHRLYERVINFGSAKDQALMLNAGTLKAIWTSLPLADEIKALWESQFPWLAQQANDLDVEPTDMRITALP